MERDLTVFWLAAAFFGLAWRETYRVCLSFLQQKDEALGRGEQEATATQQALATISLTSLVVIVGGMTMSVLLAVYGDKNDGTSAPDVPTAMTAQMFVSCGGILLYSIACAPHVLWRGAGVIREFFVRAPAAKRTEREVAEDILASFYSMLILPLAYLLRTFGYLPL